MRKKGVEGRGTGGKESNLRHCCRFILKPVSHYSCETVYFLSHFNSSVKASVIPTHVGNVSLQEDPNWAEPLALQNGKNVHKPIKCTESTPWYTVWSFWNISLFQKKCEDTRPKKSSESMIEAEVAEWEKWCCSSCQPQQMSSIIFLSINHFIYMAGFWTTWSTKQNKEQFQLWKTRQNVLKTLRIGCLGLTTTGLCLY